MLANVLLQKKFRTLYLLSFLVIFMLCSLPLPAASAATVTVAWDKNSETNVIGYELHYGTTSQDYQHTVDVENNTSRSISGLIEGQTYYFAVKAYNDEYVFSDFSEKLVYTIPNSSPPAIYTITTNAGTNGTISPTSAAVNAGGSQSFTITPDTGYRVEDVLVDGVSEGAVTTYAFSALDADHSISASFAVDTFTIQASASLGGVISPSGAVSVSYGGSQSFTITPDTGYRVEDVLVDGVSEGAVTTYAFSALDADHSISASFAVDTFTIQASASLGGVISPSGAVSVSYGGSQSFTITPDTGYRVEDVLVDGVSEGLLSSYTFDQVVEGHTIQASFIADTVTITASAGTNGSISPAGNVSVNYGSSQTFAISPDSGYVIADVWIDGVSIDAMDSYTFSNVTADHTINAAFTAENKVPTADAGPNQTVEDGQIALLSGLNSTDPDDGIAAFQWLQIQGDPVTLAFPNEPETTFTTPNVDSSGAALVFELTVTDYAGETSTDSCIVNVTWANMPPIADAGVDKTVEEGSQVVLDAFNSTDADDGIASYGWKQISGPVVTLSGANSDTPSFIAPYVGSAGGASLAFEATVTDAGGLQDTATCLINVTWENTPPVSDAGLNQNATIGDDVFLDGSKSYDADDTTITSYRWRQIKGVPVELPDATAVSPVFMVPAGAEDGDLLTFELTVTDSDELQGKDNCQINVQSIGPWLHISMITMELKHKGPNVEANAYVTIVDDVGNIVKEASVTGNWTYNGNPINTATTTTRGDGVARLYSDKIQAKSGEVFAVEITDVVKDGYSYHPASNRVTQASLIVP